MLYRALRHLKNGIESRHWKDNSGILKNFGLWKGYCQPEHGLM